MAKLSRILSDWRLYIVIGYFALALGFGAFAQHQASQERDFVLSFVCDSIAIRLEQDGPAAEEFTARFATIMREHDVRCSPPVKGLP